MNILGFEFFQGEVEITELALTGDATLMMKFPDGTHGFVRIGDITSVIREGSCELDLRLLENGVQLPELVMLGEIIQLPPFKKLGRAIELFDCTDAYIRAASQRARRLEGRILELEERLEALSERIYNTTIL